MNNRKKYLGLLVLSLIVSISLFVHSVYQFTNNVSQNSSYIWLGLGILLTNLVFIFIGVILFFKEEIFLGHLMLLFKMIFVPTFTGIQNLLKGNPTFDLFYVILFLISAFCLYYGLKIKPVVLRHVRWKKYVNILVAMGYEAVAYSIAQGIYTVIPNYILISTGNNRESKILFSAVFVRYPFVLVDALVNNPNQSVFFYLATIGGILFFIYSVINIFIKPSKNPAK